MVPGPVKVIGLNPEYSVDNFLYRQLGGQSMPEEWNGINRLGGETDIITVEVSNVLTEKKISNVFGVIKGIVDAGGTHLARLGV